jgi:phenylacetate-coenzyme A ligase PaaK-like adenylate-forming protein
MAIWYLATPGKSRDDDLIFYQDAKIYPSQIEQVLEAHPTIKARLANSRIDKRL